MSTTIPFVSPGMLIDSYEIRRLADVGSSAGRRAAARAIADYSDRLMFAEPCNSLAGYSQSVGSTLTASGNAFYGGASGGSALVALPASGDGMFRAAVPINFVGNASAGTMFRLGFSTDAPGGTPNSANVAGILISSDGTSTSGPVETWLGTGVGGAGAGQMVTGPNVRTQADTVTCSGTAVTDAKAVGSAVGSTVSGTGFTAGTTITAATPGTGYTLSAAATGTTMTISPATQRWSKIGLWRVELISDGTTLSVGLVDLATGTLERVGYVPVAGLGFQSFYLEIQDARTLSGSSVRPYSLRAGVTTARPPVSPVVTAGFSDGFTSADLTTDGYRVQSGTTLQGGGGHVIGTTGASSSNAGASRAFKVPTGAVMSCAGGVKLSASAAGTLVFGFDNQSTSTAPPTGTNSYRGLGFDTAGNLNSYDPSGAGTTLLLATAPAGTWSFVYSSDGTTLTGAATTPDGSATYTATWVISTEFPTNGISNIRLLNTDATGANKINGYTATYQVPSTGPDVAGYTGSVLTLRDATHRIAVRLPTSWDSRKVYPMLICAHGAGGSALTFVGGASTGHYDQLALTFAQAGFIVISTEAEPLGQEWAGDDFVQAQLEAWQYGMNMFAPGPVFLYGGSMGGLGTLVTMASRIIPGVAGLILNQPVCSLRAAYDSTGLRAGVVQAYNLGSYPDPTYETKTGPSATCRYGHDPLSTDMPGWALGGVPIWIEYSPDDNTVPEANHALPFIAKYGTWNQITQNVGSGDHGASGQFLPFFNAQVAWAKQIIGGLL